MADFEDPSFSLGFDFDLYETEPPPEKHEDKPQLPSVKEEPESPSFNILPDELQLDLDPDLEQEEAPVLKRLRRGPAPVSIPSDSRFETPPGVSVLKDESNGVNRGVISGSEAFSSLEDEIEDFSSQDDPFLGDRHIKNTSLDAASSSKISLRNQGVLTSQSTNKLKSQKTQNPNSISSTSSNLEKSDKTKLLPKLTLSPLRKIHLLDSDSDLDTGFDFKHTKNKPKIDIKPKEPKGNLKLATPALDQFCEEYFREEKYQNALQKKEKGSTTTSKYFREEKDQNALQKKEKGSTTTSKYFREEKDQNALQKKEKGSSTSKYFREEKDQNALQKKEKGSTSASITKYFREEKDKNALQKKEKGSASTSTSKCSSRVFDPVAFTKDFEDILPKEELSSGISKNAPPCYKYFNHNDVRIRALVRERLSHFTPITLNENIDYMVQFGKKEGVKGKRVRNRENRNENNMAQFGKKEVVKGKRVKKNSTPTNVGQNIVQAQSGHWFTNQEGKKVYVTKNGQELTGQFAYRQYKKDNGGGYRKTKKQGTSRKKGKK